MSHIDTLTVYESYIKAGFDDEKARAMTAILENSFMTKVKELKNDFVSNKIFTAFATIVVIVMTSTSGAIAGELWYLSKEVSILSRDMQEVRAYVFKEK